MYRPFVRGSARHSSNQTVFEALMVTFHVLMGHVFRYRAAQRCLPDKNHPIQAFELDHAYAPLRICIDVAALRERAAFSRHDEYRNFRVLVHQAIASGMSETSSVPVRP